MRNPCIRLIYNNDALPEYPSRQRSKLSQHNSWIAKDKDESLKPPLTDQRHHKSSIKSFRNSVGEILL